MNIPSKLFSLCYQIKIFMVSAFLIMDYTTITILQESKISISINLIKFITRMSNYSKCLESIMNFQLVQ